MVSHYWTLNFRDLVYLESIPRYDPAKPGYFGGLGMNEQEATLFYTIGAGDGSRAPLTTSRACTRSAPSSSATGPITS